MQTTNGMTLHTLPGCHISKDSTAFSGKVSTENCDVAASEQAKNVGCTIKNPSSKSYGAGLNSIGGGVYATQWTSEAISIFFFPRDSVPADVLGDNPDPTGWGKPAARFSNSGCNISKMFKQQQIVFDTTFCGEWAGVESVWNASTCSKKASTCEEWVQNNPEAFTEAYWEINALKVYQDDGQAPVSKPSAAPGYSTIISKPVSSPAATATVPVNPPQATSGFAYPTNLSAPSLPIAIPSPSDGVFAPISASSVLSKAPVKPTAVPIPSNNGTKPSPSGKHRHSRKPSRPQATQPAAPVGANGMPGFAWPIAGDGEQPENSSPSSAINGAPRPPPNAPIPSGSSPTPQAPAPAPTNAPPAAASPVSPPQGVQIVYETIYKTVTVDPAATSISTPPSAAAAMRHKRHVRQHRQKM